MSEINLLSLYPKTLRDLDTRKNASESDRRIARQFGKEYFDGTRDQGYGGYRYDGRWKPIVRLMKKHYSLSESAAVLDIGCAKGFFLHDFQEIVPFGRLAGVDISSYAIEQAMPSVSGFVKLGNALKLDFPDSSFDLVVSINTIHNLDRQECMMALREVQRVSRVHSFITVDAWRTEEERIRLLQWNLTARTFLHVDEWKLLFKETGYKGDYYWFIP